MIPSIPQTPEEHDLADAALVANSALFQQDRNRLAAAVITAVVAPAGAFATVMAAADSAGQPLQVSLALTAWSVGVWAVTQVHRVVPERPIPEEFYARNMARIETQRTHAENLRQQARVDSEA